MLHSWTPIPEQQQQCNYTSFNFLPIQKKAYNEGSLCDTQEATADNKHRLTA